MNLPLIPGGPIEAALVASIGGLLVALLVGVALRRRSRVRTSRTSNAAAADLCHEVRALGATLVAMGARFDRLEATLAIDGRMRGPAGATPGKDAGYELGVRLARAGARTEDLVSACGMRPEEAELLLRLHSRAA